MKISKSLLQAIFVGVTLGTATSSCSMFDSATGSEHEDICEQDCNLDHRANSDDAPADWECLDCGRG